MKICTVGDGFFHANGKTGQTDGRTYRQRQTDRCDQPNSLISQDWESSNRS